MRITLDSAILVRANQLSKGPARALLLEILDRGHRLVLSSSVLEEVERVLHYPRLMKRFGLTETEIIAFVAFLAEAGEIVAVESMASSPILDPNDVHILRTAISGKSDFLCTLDVHFLTLEVVAFCANFGISVISDVDLLRLIRLPIPDVKEYP